MNRNLILIAAMSMGLFDAPKCIKTTVRFRNKRGQTLVGTHWDVSFKKLIILLHGFTGDKSEWGRFDQLAEALAAQGYSVLAFDFAGCGESDDEVLEVAKQVEDFIAAKEWAKRWGYTSIGVVGLSLGGLVALKGLEDIDSLVLWAPVTAKKDNYAERKFTESQRWELTQHGYFVKMREQGVRRKFQIGQQMADDREQVDQEALLANVAIPVLIVHGDEDESVPLEDSRRAHALSEWTHLEVVPGADHDFTDQLDLFISRTVEWFVNSMPL